MVTLEPKQLKDKPRKVGDLKGDPVYQVETKGGLFLLMAKSAGKTKPIGVGPHPATARHIALRDYPELNITELSKSEEPAPELLRAQVQESLWLTRKIQEVVDDLEARKK